MKIQAYVIRHESITPYGAQSRVTEAFLRWAETSDVFSRIGRLESDVQSSVRVNMYPDTPREGFYFAERAPDAVQEISPFYLSLIEVDVAKTDRVPSALSVVAIVGEPAMAKFAEHDVMDVSESAMSGCHTFDIGDIADGCDGFGGLLYCTASAAANLPDTDMDFGDTYTDAQNQVALIVTYSR